MSAVQARPTEEQVTAFRIAEFLVRTEIDRLALFRTHLQATVVRAPALLLDLASIEGIRLQHAAALMHPPQDWPWRPLDEDPVSLLRRSQVRKGWAAPTRRSEAGRFERLFGNPGVVIRNHDDPRGKFAIRPCGRVLGFMAALGPCVVSAFGSSALLRLPHLIPETLMMALPGRPLAAVVDHPLFARHAYRIVRTSRDTVDGMPVLAFRVPLRGFEMPWAGDGRSVPR